MYIVSVVVCICMSVVVKFIWPLPHLFLRVWDQLPIIFMLGILDCSYVIYWTVHLALNALNFDTLLAVEDVGCHAEHLPSCDGIHVSYRPFTSCYNSHQCLLQTFFLMLRQSLVSPADPFASCHGSCWHLLQTLFLASVSCRPLASCHGSCWCLLQTLFLISVACRPLASCHGSHQDPPSHASVCFIITTMCPLVMCKHFKGVCLLWLWEPSHLPLYADGNPTFASGCDSSQ